MYTVGFGKVYARKLKYFELQLNFSAFFGERARSGEGGVEVGAEG